MKSKNIILIFIFIVSCGKAYLQKEYKGIDKSSFDKIYATAKNKTPNYTIIYGLTIGVSPTAFDSIVLLKINNGEMVKVGEVYGLPLIKFEVLNGESLNLKLNYSATGMFKNFPVISFKSEEMKDEVELAKTRNKLIDWAISKYGDQYHVTDMNDLSSTVIRKNFRWVANTYSIDITDNMNRVSLSYRKLEN